MCTAERFVSYIPAFVWSDQLFSPIHQSIKDKIVASTEQDTVHIFRTLHNTARVFKVKKDHDEPFRQRI